MKKEQIYLFVILLSISYYIDSYCNVKNEHFNNNENSLVGNPSVLQGGGQPNFINAVQGVIICYFERK